MIKAGCNIAFDQRENLTGMLVCNCPMRCYKFLLWLIWLVWLSQPALLVLNYLKQHQRLYKFYFRENLYIPRQEYNHYCQWVVEQLNHIEFSSHVLDIKPIKGGFDVEWCVMGTTNIIVLDNWYWEWVQLTFTRKLTTDLLKIRNLPAFIRIFTVQLPEVIRKCSFNWFWTVSSRDF